MNFKEKLITSLLIVTILIITCCTQSCSTASKIHKKPVGKRYTNTCHAYQ